MSFLKKYFGPSTLVAAAFIGPGTLTVCTLAGASHGYSLLWVLVLAILGTIILQEMAARIGLVTQNGLGEAINSQIQNSFVKIGSGTLIFVAIIFGNAAYEAGNIAGAVLGFQGVLGSSVIWPILIGLISFTVLFIGKFKWVERILVGLVLLMSFVFVVTAVLIQPDYKQILEGLFVPTIKDSNILMILALVGTTVVPYNLFLHASSVSQKWKNSAQLKDLRIENTVAIVLGGLISMAIVVTSARLGGDGIANVKDMALQLKPLLGSWATYFLAIGLFSAGISSAITAPLAAAYAAKGIFKWSGDMTSLKFRLVWGFVLLIGIIFSLTDYKPIEIIKVAQVANAVLLPVIVIFLVVISNRKNLLGAYVNTKWQNVLSIAIILFSLLLSFRSFNSLFQLL